MWFLGAFAYKFIGGFFMRLFNDSKRAMFEENENKKENETKEEKEN